MHVPCLWPCVYVQVTVSMQLCCFLACVFTLLCLSQLGNVMVDISSNLMLADERLLWMAQREARACSRIVECLQRIAVHRLASTAQAYSTVRSQ